MLTVGIALGLASAVAHTWWNTLAKRLAGNGLAGMWAYNSAGFVWLLPVVAVIVVTHHGRLDGPILAAAAVSGILHGGYGFLVQASYKEHDMAAVYPLSRGLAPVLVGLVSLAVFSQRLNGWQWLGVAVIAAAITLAARSEVAAKVVDAPARSAPDHAEATTGSGTPFALVIAVAITSYTVWDSWAVLHLHAEPVSYFCVSGLLQFAVLTALARRHLREVPAVLRRVPGQTMLVGVLIPASYLLALVAVRDAPVAVVSAARGTTVVWATIAAAVFLREPMTRMRVATVAAAIVAVGLMAVT